MKIKDDITYLRRYTCFKRESDIADTMEKMLVVVKAGQRSLNWLASYPGGNAENSYQQMREALDDLNA